MADIFVSAIVGELVNKASSFLNGNYEIQAGVKDKLERLEELLIRIQTAVEAAEGRQIKNSWLLRWLRRLKDATYEADDVLDTFDYRILEKRANEDDDKVSSSFASSSSNAAKRIRTTARSLFSCDEDVNELSNVVDKLERIAANLGEFLKQLELDGSSKKPEFFSNRRITSSLLSEEPVGREKEKESIIDLLLQSESRTLGNISVIPILGIGGVGKTTLARMVYKDERVKQHFSSIMWVCVSDNFDVVRITKEILEQLIRIKKEILEQSKYQDSPGDIENFNSPGDIENFNNLQVTLKEKLRSERFLLVLDDVWNENEKTLWEKLRTPLLYGKEGSKIIVTSRLPKVAKLMGTVEPIRLQGLPEDEFWSFFKKCAFSTVDPEEHPELLVILKKIAQKLKGSPLAAKTMGALLNNNLNDEYWLSILKSDIWELEQGEDDIMPVLRLSYQHLPVHLQRCFAYCSVFPKDWSFYCDHLIYMWIAEGLICKTNGKKRPEDIAKEYFYDLISKEFFHTRDKEEIWHVTIHDLLHDLAESVSKDVYSRIDDGELQKIPESVRHLSIMTTNLAGLTKYSSIFKQLRTLNFLFRGKFVHLNVADLHEILKMLKSIRVLNFDNCRMEVLPISTCHLIHLRYLNLWNSGIKVLPEELCRSYHLERLNLKGLELDRIPMSINKLTNLRHIDYTEVPSPLVTKIFDIGKLTSLQELGIFCVEKMRGFEIKQLKTLNELRGSLQIRNLESVDSKDEAMEAKLSDKGSLVELKLQWSDTQRNVSYEVEEEVLEGLQPHPHLKSLGIVGYGGVQSPSWLMANHCFKNVVRLKLCGCRKWKELPPLEQFLTLKSLTLREMDSIEQVGSGVIKGFPLLESLELDNLPELKEWCPMDDDQLFPRLQSLVIINCSKLMALPSLPPTVEKIHLNRVGLIRLPPFRRPICPSLAFASSSSSPSPSPFLSKLTILDCPNLKNIDEWPVQEWEKLSQLQSLHVNYCPSIYLLPPSLKDLEISGSGIGDVELSSCLQRDLSSLTQLTIRRCPCITTLLSADELQRLTKLSHLYIDDCGELRSIGGFRALHSLEYLSVLRCPKLNSLAVGVEQGVEEDVHLLTAHSDFRLCIDDPLLLKVLLSREGRNSLKFLRVVYVNELTTFTTEMEEALQQLTSLQTLSFELCNSLQCLPACLKYLAITRLAIVGCPNIQSLPCTQLPSSSQGALPRGWT